MAILTPWRTATAAGAENEEKAAPRPKWNLGILSDPQTDEVPGEHPALDRVRHSDLWCGLRHPPLTHAQPE